MNRKQPWLHIYRNLDAGGGGGAPAPAAAPATPPVSAPAAPASPAAPAAAPAAPGKPAGDPPVPAGFDYGAWAEGLTDAQKKDYAKRFKGNDDLLDAALNMRKDLSTRIKVPDDKATPEDIAAFRKAIKASDKAEDYKASLPEKYELSELSTAMLTSMQKAAVETGVPVASFAAFTKTYFEMEAAVQAKVTEEVDQYRRDNEAELKKEFGADYDKLTRAARQFVEQRLNVPEFNALLEDNVTWNGVSMQLGSHPAVIKMLAQIGQRTAEDGVIGYRTQQETQGLRGRINELEAKYPMGQRTKAQDAEIAGLYSKLYD